MVVLFLASARVIHSVQDAPKAVGHQFRWEYRYPALGVATANELHVPVSDPSHPTSTFLMLLSGDTDHSFWVPRLAGKTDLTPNRVNEMWIEPHETGVYIGQCTQYCGTQHAKMRVRVYVDTTEQFESWVRQQLNGTRSVDAVSAGRHIFDLAGRSGKKNLPASRPNSARI